VITLNRPDASFLASLAGRGAAIVAQEVVEENGGLDTVAVGTGPFTFVEYVPNTRVVLQKNPSYREAGKPYLDEIEFIPIPDDTQRTNALLTDTVNFIEYAPLQDIESLESDGRFTIAGETNTNIRYIHFNFNRESLGDLRVRQAIEMALDREQILEPAVYGRGLATQVIFPPDYWAYYDVPAMERDVEGAKALLAEAGYPDGFDIEILSWAQYAFLNQAAYVVQAQLQEIGINSEVVLEENAIFVERLYATSDYDMSVTGTSAYIDPNDIFATNFASDAPNNSMGYANARADELIAQGIAETDQAARKDIYAELQQLLYDEKPWIPLFIANQYEAMLNTIHGYVHIATGTNYTLKDTWIEQ
jgi:peptide/nickel transport system substrate-binding protein